MFWSNVGRKEKPAKVVSKIFHLQNTKFITATYHKLPENFSCTEALEHITREFEQKLIADSKKNTIINLTIVKEPYDLNTNPDNKGLVHLHVLIELNKKLRINSQKKTAKLFTFSYQNQTYFPHISPCRDYEAYVSYMFKLRSKDEQYSTSEWSSSIVPLGLTATVSQVIEDIKINFDNYTKQDVRSKLKHIRMSDLVYNQKSIDFLFNKLPETREKLEDFVIRENMLKYTEKDYRDNPNYLKIKEEMKKFAGIRSKQSLFIHGIPNTAKTSMVFAAAIALAKDKSKEFLIVKFSDPDDLKVINQIDSKKYFAVFLIIDDVTPEGEIQEKRTYILNLYSGNESPTTLKCRYENAKFTGNMVKIFTHNMPFEKAIKKAEKEYNTRIKEIKLDNSFHYESEF